MTERKDNDKYHAVVRATDMPEDLKQEVIAVACRAIERQSNERDMAEEIQKYFHYHYSGSWHCIVGRNFGIYVTHQQQSFIRLVKGQLNVLLFKCSG